MKVFISHLFHESNSFSADRTDIKRFATGGYCIGDAVRSRYEGSNHYIGGMLKAAEEEGAETVFGISLGTAGPMISKGCIDYYVDIFIKELEKYATEIDGLCLALHGAGVAEGIDDIEGYLLRKIRSIVGDDMPITASLDLHANISSDMVRLCNGIFGIKTYPHVDADNAGYMAMKNLIRHIRGEINLTMTCCQIPAIVPFAKMNINHDGPAKEINEYIDTMKQKKGYIDISFFHGFCYADIHDAGMSVLIVSDKEEMKSASDIAKYIWTKRFEMIPETISIENALDAALSEMEEGRIVVMCERSDHAGAGGPNDGTLLLEEIINKNIEKSIFVGIYDPALAKKAYEAGVGAIMDMEIGAKTDNRHGRTLKLKDVEVLGVSDGHFNYTTPMYFGQPYCVGKTARLKAGNVEIIINSVPRQTHDDRMIFITGGDVRDYKLICLKSGVAYKAFYSTLPEVKKIVECDPPGICCCDLNTFDFKNIRRPIFPLDDDTNLKLTFL